MGYDHAGRDVVIAARQGFLRLAYVDAVGRPRPRCPACDCAQPPGADRCPTCGTCVGGRRVPVAVVGAALVTTAVVLVALSMAVAGGMGALSGSGELYSLGFGTGQSECRVTNVASTFARGTRVVYVAPFRPNLPAGSTVRTTVEYNGAAPEPIGYQEIDDEGASCAFNTFLPLDPGRYRVSVEVTPSNMPPISGEFEVTAQ